MLRRTRPLPASGTASDRDHAAGGLAQRDSSLAGGAVMDAQLGHGNQAAQDAMRRMREGGGSAEPPPPESVDVPVPFRKGRFRLQIPPGERSVTREPNARVAEGITLSEVSVDFDAHWNVTSGSVKVKVDGERALWRGAGVGVTLEGGQELGASFDESGLKQATWSVDAAVRDSSDQLLMRIGMHEASAQLGGDTPQISGQFSVAEFREVRLRDLLRIESGGGFTGVLANNQLESFEASGLQFSLPRFGLERVGSIGRLWYLGKGGAEWWRSIGLDGVNMSSFALPRVGLPGASLVDVLLTALSWDGANIRWEGGGTWRIGNFDLGVRFDLDGFGLPKISLDLGGGGGFKLPFSPSLKLFSLGGSGDPWKVFDFARKLKLRIGRANLDYELRFFLMAELDVALRKADISVTPALEEYEFDPSNPLALPKLSLSAEATADKLLEADGRLVAGGEAIVPGKRPPGWLALTALGKGQGALTAGGTAGAKLVAGPDGFGATGSVDFDLGGALKTGFDMQAEANVLGVSAGPFSLFSLPEVVVPSPFTWDFAEDLLLGSVPGEELGADALLSRDQGVTARMAEDFERENPKKQEGDQGQLAEGNPLLTKVQHLIDVIDMFGDLVGVFGSVHAILRDWAVDPTDHDAVLTIARKKMGQAEHLIECATGFYDKVSKAEASGLFDFLEREFPAGKGLVAFLKAYLYVVDAAYRGGSKLAGVLGGTDVEAEHAAIDEGIRKGAVTFGRLMKKQRRMIAEGFDWVSAERITGLEMRADNAFHNQNTTRIDPTSSLLLAQALELETRAQPLVDGSERFRDRKTRELVAAGIPLVAAVEIAAIYRLAHVNVTGDTGFAAGAAEWEAEARATVFASFTDEDKERAAAQWAARKRPKREWQERGGRAPAKR